MPSHVGDVLRGVFHQYGAWLVEEAGRPSRESCTQTIRQRTERNTSPKQEGPIIQYATGQNFQCFPSMVRFGGNIECLGEENAGPMNETRDRTNGRNASTRCENLEALEDE